MMSLLSVLLTVFLISGKSPSANATSVISLKDSLPTGWYFVRDTATGVLLTLDRTDKSYYIDPVAVLTATDIVKTELFTSIDSSSAIEMDFSKNGALAWEKATDLSYKYQYPLAFVLDGRLLVVAIAHNGKITSGQSAIIRSEYSKTEVEAIKKTLDAEIGERRKH